VTVCSVWGILYCTLVDGCRGRFAATEQGE